jgi:hypothetical protein
MLIGQHLKVAPDHGALAVESGKHHLGAKGMHCTRGMCCFLYMAKKGMLW